MEIINNANIKLLTVVEQTAAAGSMFKVTWLTERRLNWWSSIKEEARCYDSPIEVNSHV